MQSIPLDLEAAAPASPRTIWRTPQGIPSFSSPFALHALWRRACRLLVRRKRVMR